MSRKGRDKSCEVAGRIADRLNSTRTNVPDFGIENLVRRSKRRYACVFAALLLTTAASGCHRNRANLSSVPAARVHAPAVGATFVVSKGTGVYRAGPHDPDCCWLAQRATFYLNLPAGATKLRMAIFVPDFPATHRHSLSLAIIIDGHQTSNITKLKFGATKLTVPLHVTKLPQMVTVEFVPNFSFVPKDEHINTDTRNLSLILSSLKAE